MSLTAKLFFGILILFLYQSALAGSIDVKVFIYSDNESISKDQFRRYTDDIFLSDKKSGISEFGVYHMTSSNSFPETWSEKKLNAQYYPQKIDCNFNQCESLRDFISSKQSGKSKLFIAPGYFECNVLEFGIENAPFDGSIINIKNKVQEEILLNKKLGLDISLIFYLPTQESISKPALTVNKTTYEITEGDELEFDLEFKNTSNYFWEPSTGLDCSDCESPKASPMESVQYEVYGANEIGCLTEKKVINVDVKKKCSGYDASKILYHSDKELYRRVLGNENRYLIASDQPGSKIYYLVCSTNCCTEFSLSVHNLEGGVIWQEIYSLEQIVDNPKLSEDHTDKFIFKVDLENASNFNSREFYTFKIKCIDEESDKFKLYNSPPTKFVDCGFTE